MARAPHGPARRESPSPGTRPGYARRPVIAFLPSLGWQEMFLLLVIGLLLYGRNLPEAGRTFGQFVARLKRGYQEFKDQIDRDESIREVRKTLADTTREVRDVTKVPRAIADPASALRDLTNEAMSSPLPTRRQDGNQTSDAADNAR
jgi:Sec-independent protein translocase protein TatA